MSGDLDIIELGASAMAFPSARGRKPAPLNLTAKRGLTVEEAVLIECGEPVGSGTPPIQRIRETHHALARLLAQGVKPVEAGAITGYSPSRISILQKDPAFAELLEFYKENVQEKYLDVHERLARLGGSFVDELQERLEEKPEDFSVGQLMEGAKLTLDRSVAPPKNATTAATGAQAAAGARGTNIQITFVAPGTREGILPPPNSGEDDIIELECVRRSDI